MREQRVMGIFAHPDDESLVAGGVLAACAAAGMDVILLSLTAGEHGPIEQPAVATRETLRSVRERELQAAAGILGAREAICLDYPDGSLWWVDRDLLRDDIARRIRDCTPRAIITFAEEGLYWYKDHIAVHEAVCSAVATCSVQGVQPWIYEATWPRNLAGDLVHAMESRGLSASLWGLSTRDFGSPPGRITTVLNVRPYLARKLQALRAHASQVGPDHLLTAIPPDLADRFLGDEYFIRRPPSGARGDMLGEMIAAHNAVVP